MVIKKSGNVGLGIRSPTFGIHNPVEEALKNLTYADKKGVDYFNASVVQYETERIDVPVSRPEAERQLEGLVSKEIAHKIIGNIGSSKRRKLSFYRYK